SRSLRPRSSVSRHRAKKKRRLNRRPPRLPRWRRPLRLRPLRLRLRHPRPRTFRSPPTSRKKPKKQSPPPITRKSSTRSKRKSNNSTRSDGRESRDVFHIKTHHGGTLPSEWRPPQARVVAPAPELGSLVDEADLGAVNQLAELRILDLE